MDQLLADETVDDGGAEDVLWPLGDWQGSVRHLATYDASTDVTTIANEKVYDAYGNVASETNSAVDTVFGYTGRMWDDDTGLQNNLNRWYDPVVGRWVSEDPIGFAAGDVNLYRYVGNSPGMGVDPSGLEWTWWAGTKGFVAGVGQGGVNIVTGLLNTGKEMALGGTDVAVGATEAVGNFLGANWHFDTYSNLGRASQQKGFSYGSHVARTGVGVVTFGTSEQIITGYEWYRGDISDNEASARFGATGTMQFLGARALAKQPGFWNEPIPGTPRIPGAGRLAGYASRGAPAAATGGQAQAAARGNPNDILGSDAGGLAGQEPSAPYICEPGCLEWEFSVPKAPAGPRPPVTSPGRVSGNPANLLVETGKPLTGRLGWQKRWTRMTREDAILQQRAIAARYDQVLEEASSLGPAQRSQYIFEQMQRFRTEYREVFLKERTY